MDEIHVHKTKKSICAHFAESPCISKQLPLPQLALCEPGINVFNVIQVLSWLQL